MADQVPGGGYLCEVCGAVEKYKNDYRDHLISEHAATHVVCPLCVILKVLKTPSSLKRHIKSQHPATKMDSYMTTGLARCFAVDPILFDRTGVDTVPLKEGETAKGLMRTWWREVGKCDRTKKIAEAHGLDNYDPPTKVRKLEYRELIPRKENLSTTYISISQPSSESWITNLNPPRAGFYQVTIADSMRELVRKLSDMPAGYKPNPTTSAISVNSRALRQVLAAELGIGEHSIRTTVYYPEEGADSNNNKATLPTCTVTEVPPEAENDSCDVPVEAGPRAINAAPATLPTSTVTLNPTPTITPTAPVTHAPTPTVTHTPTPHMVNSPVGKMTPVPDLMPTLGLRDVPAAALAPKPQPTLTGKGKVRSNPTALSARKQPPAIEVTEEQLLRKGSWPLLSPGRRDWEKYSIQLELPVTHVTWPPSNWHEMSAAQRSFAQRSLAAILSLGDHPDGSFPAASPAVISEDYNFLALPGSSDDADSESRMRRAVYQSLKESSGSTKEALVSTLTLGAGKGPAACRDALRQVDDAGVSLLPFFKGQPFVSQTEGYDPTKPDL